jgi:hypothetical protein
MLTKPKAKAKLRLKTNPQENTKNRLEDAALKIIGIALNPEYQPEPLCFRTWETMVAKGDLLELLANVLRFTSFVDLQWKETNAKPAYPTFREFRGAIRDINLFYLVNEPESASVEPLNLLVKLCLIGLLIDDGFWQEPSTLGPEQGQYFKARNN